MVLLGTSAERMSSSHDLRVERGRESPVLDLSSLSTAK
jgi:hypothetical protein